MYQYLVLSGVVPANQTKAGIASRRENGVQGVAQGGGKRG